ncbi:hypothetical protein DL768_002932 [Monosporascus sp. mg162]|nr:hypothetical protein DL768_002932 [Monosporascus sp. mg162]
MASTQHHLLLIGDQTDDVTATIQSLYADARHSGLLSEYLQRCSDVCQIEVSMLKPALRSEIPPFESVQELAEQHAKTDGSPVIQSAVLSYISRLGEVIMRAWVGVVGRSWSTISAPPTTLQSLIENSPEIKALTGFPLPVGTAVHAPYLHEVDFGSLRKKSDIWDIPLDEKAVLMSTERCEPYPAGTLGELLPIICHDVAYAQLKVDATIEATANRVKETGAFVNFTTCGPSAQSAAMINGLKAAKVPFKVTPRPKWEAIDAPQRGGTGAIAIIGMAGRFPGSNDLDRFWDNLMEGKVFVEKIPPNRFDLHDFYDETGQTKNSIVTVDGCFIEDPGSFDPRLFNMSPREAMHMDPVHRLLLMVTMEALEKAGHNPENSPADISKRTSVWFGQNADVWREINCQQGVDVFTAPGLLRAFSPGRVNYHFGFEGGSYSLDAACSSSSTAIQLACAALERRECDMAVAGGAQVASNPFEFAALGKSGFLSRSGGCKTFRSDADGYCRGEAAGVVVLKRLEDALADNDNIEAVITGYGRNYSADASSITHPHPQTQAKLYRQVLRQANRSPGDIGYVELHGTGTISGDLSEMTLVTSTFNGHFSPEKPLHIGALKANLGHSESAAGVSSIIKAALVAKKGICPPQASITPTTRLHPGFADLDTSTIKIDTEPARITKTKVMINNFDAAGGNTCLLVEAAPAPQVKVADPRSWHSVTVSARTSKSLKGNKMRLLDYLVKHPNAKLADVSYSTTARRMHHSLKATYTASTTEDLISMLQTDTSKPKQEAKPHGTPDAVFMFTGQGSHYMGMGHELYNTNEPFRQKLNWLQGQCDHLQLPCFLDIITQPTGDLANFSTVQVQLAIMCLELALAELWMSWGIKPSMVLGHSLGEYAALCIAGVLSTIDTLYLVGTRASILQARCTKNEFGMLSLQATPTEVESILREGGFSENCEHACFNSPRSNVISGPVSSLMVLDASLKTKGVKTKLLQLPYAFHSAQLDAILEDFKTAASTLPFAAPTIPVASTLTGQLVDKEGTFNGDYLAAHARKPVRFVDALQNIMDNKAKGQQLMWLEVGPSLINSALLRETLDVAPAELLTSLKSGEANWKTICTSMGRAYVNGLHVNWPEFHRHYLDSVRLLDLPTYAFDLKPFWKTYTKAHALQSSGMSLDDNAQPSGRETASKFTPTAMVQTIDSEMITPEKIKVTFKSSLTDQRVRAVMKGHNIEGTAICPATAFVDMAVTAAKYVHTHALPGKKTNGTLADLELVSPLVLKDESIKQSIEIRVVAEAKDNWTCIVSFHSKSEGGKLDDNGKCKVTAAEPSSTKSEWTDKVVQAKERMSALMSRSGSSFVHHMNSRIFYRLFNSIVRYGKRYQGCQEAFVDYDAGDAVAKIKLASTPASDRHAFVVDPYHSESLVQLAGFLLNTGGENSDEIIHFSSGISDIMITEEFGDDKTYYCYTRMTTDAKGESTGEIFMMDAENNLVGCGGGIKFHQMRRQVLKMSLSLQSGAPLPAAAPMSAPLVAGIAPALAKPTASAHVSSKCIADAFLNALMSETGVEHDDMEDGTLLTELGVDSLMGMAILQNVQQTTGETLPATIFFELQTVGDVKAHLGGYSSGDESAVSLEEDSPISYLSDTTSISTGHEDAHTEPIDPSDLAKKYTSKAILLQGNLKSDRRPLFFVAGSSGAAAIYAQLPSLKSGTPIYALESPFLHCPHEMKYTPQEIAPVYLATIKEIQKEGPYLIGGYSAGAVHAYEISKLMLKSGVEVERLILSDMKAHRPGETWTEPPQIDDMDCAGSSINVVDKQFKVNRTAELARAQRFASLQCVYNWKPTPMAADKRPTHGTTMIWARWGMCERLKIPGLEADPEINPMSAESRGYKNWFYSRRHTYDANGWDVLCGPVDCHVIDGDHWNMLEPPYAEGLMKKIDEAIVTLP